MQPQATSKVWFITGISSGLGKALVEEVAESGDYAVGTFRNLEQVEDFNNPPKERAFAVKLDITQPGEIEQAVETVLARWGRIDVLVNNAGFGFAGAVEEASAQELREVLETNFFGVFYVTQCVLPALRRQRSGHIIQISSHNGFRGSPGFGIYNASKFAVEGMSEALAAEVAPLGIKLTIVEPGPLRTNFAGNAFREAERIIEDYATTAGAFRTRIKQIDGKQEGHPQKAAKAILQIASVENPPLRLPLGKIAVATLNSKLSGVQKDLEAWTGLAESAVY